MKKSGCFPCNVLLFVAFLGLVPGMRADTGNEFLRDGTRSVLDLGGEWEVLPIDGIHFDFPPPAKGWIREKVPAKRSKGLRADGSSYAKAVSELLISDKSALVPLKGYAAWFRRSFDLASPLPPGDRARLVLDGLAFKSEVWLNGKKLGGSVLGQVPSTYDVTGILKPGGNELVIALAGRPALIDVAAQTYVAPVSGVGAGIWGPVKLEFLPGLHIESVFVHTNVKGKRIRFDVGVTNTTKKQRRFVVDAGIVNSRQEPQARIKGEEVSLASGETRVIRLEKNWIAPHLWTPASPALYFANVSLQEGGAVVDRRIVRFGFREFEIRDRDFYLNGVRTTLLRNSSLRSLSSDREDLFAKVRQAAGQPYNCIRLHIGFNSEELLDLCDELGVMAVPESAWHNIVNKFPLSASDRWLPNVEDYTRRLITRNFNHPSVVMWNLTNESFWGKTDAERMAIADRLVKAARDVDPDRPLDGDAEVSWGGRLDAINIHYPEASVGNSLRQQYPDSAFVFPNDWFWLKKEGENTSWRATFAWDRPLVIGEYWFPSGDADAKSSFMGESIYDWEKWRHERLDGRGDEDVTGNDFLWSQKGLADAYRIQGVAGLNPWASDGRKVLPPVAVRPVDFFPNFFGGTTASRTFALFNDSGRTYASTNLQCRLEAGGRTLWEKTLPVSLPPGEIQQIEVPVECPSVTEPVTAKLTVRLRYERGGSWMALDRYEDTVFLMPRPDLSDLDASKIRLLGKDKTTAQALATLGFKLAPAATITSADLEGVREVIIGENTDVAASRELLSQFAKNGGTVIVLRQTDWTPLIPELPEIDKEHVATRSWRRTYHHPVTEGMDDRQFSFWRPDHLVSLRTFRKPAAGPSRILLDAGGLYGLRWSPLLEVPYGKGVFMLTSLDLANKVSVEPAAARLLANMIRYGLDYRPRALEPLRLLAADNPALRAALDAAGVVFVKSLDDGGGPVLLDASFKLPTKQKERIADFLRGGGKVWLHGFDPESIKTVAAWFPFPPVLKPYDPSVLSAARRSEDPLMNNLSSFDFFWTKVNLGARSDYFGDAQPTAKLGGDVLQLPSVQAGEPLTEPALLVKVPSGKGEILFDTLAWDKALGFEADKVMRVVASLAANLGAEVRATVDTTQYRFDPVDIQPHANMGYYDATANDGKGGWTDQGENDLRFFLINHLGRAGGLETGMEIEAQPFPEKVMLGGRPFWLLDARKTGGRAVISLRGGEHAAKLPSAVKDIQVNRKADKLFFLHAASWKPSSANQEVARYLIHYADGTQAVFPIHFGVEVGDWWNPEPVARAQVAWTGRSLHHSPVGIYETEWENPFPDKEITSIDVVGDLSATQFLVLGVTTGVVSGKEGNELLSEWKLQDFKDGVVPNLVSGGGPLLAGEDAPMLSTESSRPGLRFEGGQSLHVKTGELPGLGGFGEANRPFALRMKLLPTDISPGFYGGLFQAAGYGQSGFRMLLDRQLKVVVQVFDNGIQGLQSRSSLELGRMYALEFRLDGRYATLLIDRRIDAVKEMPLPAPFDGEVIIGRASGESYFFKGLISEIALDSLSPVQ